MSRPQHRRPEDEDHAYLRDLLGGDGLRGPGDDAALVELGGRVLATIDPVVEGQHFLAGTSPARIGRKLVNRSFSDLAAMGARPKTVLVSFCFGSGWLRRQRRALYRATLAAVERFDARWGGGDLASTPGASVFSCCALGLARRVVGRAALRRGDLLCVTGPLGGSLRSGHHLDFVPRVAFGERLANAHRVRAMIDVSDGLALDLARMLTASGGVGAELDADAVPRRRGVSLEAALGDGEDYELLFAVPPRRLTALRADRGLPAIARRPIGRVTKEAGVWLCRPGAERQRVEPAGWQHDLA